MDFDDRLTDAFDRGLREGLDSLSAVDRELFHVQDFIIEFEMGGLSGYLYNRLPDLDRIGHAVTAMKRLGFGRLADLLAQAAGLFNGYRDPAPRTTWDEVRKTYDPAGRIDAIDSAVDALGGDYGHDGSAIT